MYRTVYATILYHPSFFSVSPLTSRFLLTMVAGGFNPYHRLWPDDAPAECAGITPTPWTMMPTIGFVSYHQGSELLSPPPNDKFVGWSFFGKKILHNTMHMHL
jgi:hypothetical protein